MKTLIRTTPTEGWLQRQVRRIRSLVRSMRRPPGMNHYCQGESGSGEWSCRSDVPSICYYCKEPNDALRNAPNPAICRVEEAKE